MGILLVAYGLLNLSASAFDPRANMEPFARPMNASERMMLPQDPYAARYVYNDGSVRRFRTATRRTPHSQLGTR